VSDVLLIVGVAAITYTTRVVFLIRPSAVPGGLLGRFLNVFPLALFVAIATSSLAAPEGTPAVTPALAGALGGVIGGAAFRRSLWGVLAIGAGFFYLARALSG
jgi:branched-subunit amino acid transport protein